MVKILAVCGCGLGSSFAIEMSVESVLKIIGVKAKLDHTTVSEAASFGADIIITSNNFAKTLSLNPSIKIPVIPLKRLTDKKEIQEKLEPILKELNYL
ncbi:MAG: PTS sugar transporter subunit IIB [Fusobacteriaceae bacterium]